MNAGLLLRCLRLLQGRLGFVVVALRDANTGVGLVDLLDGDVLLFEQRLDAMQVIGCQLELCLGSGDCSLRACNRGGGCR